MPGFLRLSDILEIPGLTTGPELEYLSKLVQSAPNDGMVVELGTFKGRSVAALCRAASCSRVVTVDNYQMQHHGDNGVEVPKQNLKDLCLNPRLIEHETADFDMNEVPAFDGKIAMMFIDSHHHPDTFRKEMANYGPYLIEGAVVALHDIGHADDGTPDYPGYVEAIMDYFDDPRWECDGPRVHYLQAWRLKEPL